MSKDDNRNIATPTPAYDALKPRWKVPELLMSGTQALRKAHLFTLPQEPREPDEAYKRRWRGSTLFNAYKRTVGTLSGKPFSRPLNVKGLPPEMEYLRKDSDRMSTPMERFVQKAIGDRINYGKALIMVRMPPLPEGTTEADRHKFNLRPYFARLPATSLIGWTYSDTGILATIRLRYIAETVENDKNTGLPVHIRLVDVVEVWSIDTFWIYHLIKDENDGGEEKWKQVNTGINELDKVPLVVSGRLDDGPMLEDLANLNMQHFRSRSDQDTILHVARVPLLHFAGWEVDQVETTVSVHNSFVNRNKDSKISYIEIEGSSIEAGKQDLEHLEDQMLVMGADLLTLKPGNPTATAKVIDTSEKVSDLQSIVIDMEFDLLMAFQYAAEYLGVNFSEELEVTMSKEFGVTIKQREELDVLVRARQTLDISRPRFLRELERRGVFADDFDIEQELKDIEKEDFEMPNLNRIT